MTEHQIVKPLEWRRPPQSFSLSRAETVIGTYRVWTHLEANGRWFWELQGAGIERGDSADEIEAKAAAQAHFDAAILSALSVSLPSLQEIAEKEARISAYEKVAAQYKEAFDALQKLLVGPTGASGIDTLTKFLKSFDAEYLAEIVMSEEELEAALERVFLRDTEEPSNA